ncbi:MAG: hypothetical protein WDO13_17645 [Verrucomicrobiota bacterium]
MRFGYHLFSVPVATEGRLHGFIEGGRAFYGKAGDPIVIEPLRRLLRRSRWSNLAADLDAAFGTTPIIKAEEMDLLLNVFAALATRLAAEVSSGSSPADPPGIPASTRRFPTSARISAKRSCPARSPASPG